MKNLLKFEFYKFFKRIWPWVFCLFILLSLLGTLSDTLEYTLGYERDSAFDYYEDDYDYDDVDYYSDSEEGTAEYVLEQSINDGEYGKGLFLLAAASSSITFCLLLLTPFIMCYDYVNNTAKNIVAKGYKKTSIHFSKVILLSTIAVSMTVLSWLISYLYGSIVSKNFMFTFDGYTVELIITQLVTVLAYCAMYIFFSSVTTKPSWALLLSIFCPLAFSGIATYLAYELEVPITKFILSSGALDFDSSLLSLVFGYSSGTPITQQLIVAIVWGTLFTVAGWLIRRKKEV